MQGNSRNPFVQAKGCAAFSEMASFSMRERHSRYEGMFTFKRSAEAIPPKPDPIITEFISIIYSFLEKL